MNLLEEEELLLLGLAGQKEPEVDLLVDLGLVALLPEVLHLLVCLLYLPAYHFPRIGVARQVTVQWYRLMVYLGRSMFGYLLQWQWLLP